MPLPADLLQRPAALGARIVALAFLDQAAQASARLADPADTEALHDFRVALRRLRSTLRAYRPLVDTAVTKKQRRRLRELGDRTNAGRDAEVQVAWLRDQAARVTPRDRAGWAWLVDRLEQRREHESGVTLSEVRKDFPALERRLRRSLSEYRLRVPGAEDPPEERFGTAARAAIETHAQELGQALVAVRSAADTGAAHAARIAAKRVRYLLEPLAARTPDGAAIVLRLKALQDALGELNDCRVLDAELADGAAALGAARARRLHDTALADGPEAARRAARSSGDGRRGLMALARLVRARRDALFGAIVAEWLGGAAGGVVARLEGAAAALDAVAATPRRGRPRRAWRRGAPRSGAP